jgi:hypothetical protein
MPSLLVITIARYLRKIAKYEKKNNYIHILSTLRKYLAIVMTNKDGMTIVNKTRCYANGTVLANL